MAEVWFAARRQGSFDGGHSILTCSEEILAQIRYGQLAAGGRGPGIYCATLPKSREHPAPRFSLLGILYSWLFYLGKTYFCSEN